MRERLSGPDDPGPDSDALMVLADCARGLREARADADARIAALWETFAAQPVPEAARELHGWMAADVAPEPPAVGPGGRVPRPDPTAPASRSSRADDLRRRALVLAGPTAEAEPPVAEHHRRAATLLVEVDGLRDAARARCQEVATAVTVRLHDLAEADPDRAAGRLRMADALADFRRAEDDAATTARAGDLDAAVAASARMLDAFDAFSDAGYALGGSTRPAD